MAANQLAADDTKRMAKDMARLSVEDDGEEVVVISENTGEDFDISSLCLIGHFLTERLVNFTAMKHTLAALMKPVMGFRLGRSMEGCMFFSFIMLWI